MRIKTKRSYEKRIAALEELLDKADARSSRWYTRFRMEESNYDRLLNGRRQGEKAKKWSIEQAIMANVPDVVPAAKQIADYVFGPDEEENTP